MEQGSGESKAEEVGRAEEVEGELRIQMSTRQAFVEHFT